MCEQLRIPARHAIAGRRIGHKMPKWAEFKRLREMVRGTTGGLMRAMRHKACCEEWGLRRVAGYVERCATRNSWLNILCDMTQQGNEL